MKLTAYFSDDFSKKLPSSIHSLFSAFLELSLDNLPLLNQSCQECIQLAFIESEHPSSAQLQNVLPLTWVPCGDLLIFDYSQDPFDPPVLYLDLYAAEYHLYVLAHLQGFSGAIRGSGALRNRGYTDGSLFAKQNRWHPA